MALLPVFQLVLAVVQQPIQRPKESGESDLHFQNYLNKEFIPSQQAYDEEKAKADQEFNKQKQEYIHALYMATSTTAKPTTTRQSNKHEETIQSFIKKT